MVTVKPWILLAFLVACDKGTVSGGSGAGNNGVQTFQNVCAQCHGPKGKPNEAMVARLLRLKHAPRPSDAADGVAVALTHVIRS